MIGIKLLSALASATVLLTLVWVAWALKTPGNYFANGSAFLAPSLLLAVLTGGILGWRAPSKIRALLLSLAVIALAYWTLMPAGWWAHSLK